MFGYMTAKQAKAEGFTHHGSYLGIPIWIGDIDRIPIVATKWEPMELTMTVFQHIDQTLRRIFWPHAEAGFLFQIHKPIGDTK